MRCYMKCVQLPGTSCPTGIARYSRRRVPTRACRSQRSTTRWCALPGLFAGSPKRSKRLPTNTAGDTSRCCPTTIPRIPAGMDRNLSTRCSATMKTTPSRGSDSVLDRKTNNSTTVYSRYDQLHEVFTTLFTS